ncbi:hypothetical protein TTHERM_000522559 (macronuclear) [Tetrahymena thermophila SB210]|uniref:Uncharacterized protein n=1 Tax=Tetrahymena thermophila (strain SB210) TaxID=312017 RepID=W7XBH1_TETTS|nr:hypothetical protein TTHERM_000522559 [Tetrahymena thermophila SB210]EWS74687.1 hypothetical protein TTHERM_000522559 [Tetrahymena thermophila SB210]|eukprot:XP_012652777.1 hypothetical protein TTHERM_000522559 [Tetrahymena thermophila SB210]
MSIALQVMKDQLLEQFIIQIKDQTCKRQKDVQQQATNNQMEKMEIIIKGIIKDKKIILENQINADLLLLIMKIYQDMNQTKIINSLKLTINFMMAALMFRS